MAQEIELKLALAEDAQNNFLRHPLLKQATRRQSFRLINLYYDTPALELRARGIALRLRAQGKLWLQTVKCAGTAAGGLSARPEWETPYVGHFDFAAVDNEDVRNWLERPKLKPFIAPIFETSFQRITWFFSPAPGTRIALMLDRGWIAAGGRREAISEVEIEVIEGDAAHLLDLARTLAERIPLAPAPLSKAERGYRLFKQTPAAPVKAAPIPSGSPCGPRRSLPPDRAVLPRPPAAEPSRRHRQRRSRIHPPDARRHAPPARRAAAIRPPAARRLCRPAAAPTARTDDGARPRP